MLISTTQITLMRRNMEYLITSSAIHHFVLSIDTAILSSLFTQPTGYGAVTIFLVLL